MFYSQKSYGKGTNGASDVAPTEICSVPISYLEPTPQLEQMKEMGLRYVQVAIYGGTPSQLRQVDGLTRPIQDYTTILNLRQKQLPK